MREVYEETPVFDGLILGSPACLWSVGHRVKTFMDPPCAISIEAHLYRRFENKADNVSLTAGRTLGVDALSVINNCFLSDGRLVAGLMITDYGREKIEVKSPVRHLAQLIKATLRLGLKSQMVS